MCCVRLRIIRALRYTFVDKKFPILSSLLQTPENEAVICFREVIRAKSSPSRKEICIASTIG